MNKLQKNKLFVQVTYRDFLEKLWLIFLFKVNCEVYINPVEINSYDAAKIARSAALLNKRGALRRVHAPICDPNKEGFEKYKKIFDKTLTFCAHLGADAIVVHSEGYWPDEYLYIWKDMASAAGKNAVTVLIENHQERSASPIVKILSDVNSAYLKACFDIGHFYVFGEKDLFSILKFYPAEMISEVHLSDNMGDEDSHMPLGDGKINFLSFFKELDNMSLKPYCTIEAKDLSGILKGMSYLKKTGLL